MRITKREKIIPIILAAGSSEHLGFPKALAKFGKKTAVQIAVDNCSTLGRPIVVLGYEAEKVRHAAPRTAQVLVNRRWRDGQLSSLVCGLKRVPLSAAILIYPVDLPLLRKRTIQAIVRAFRIRKPGEQIVMPRRKQTCGHPVVLSGALRGELAEAKSAREVVYRIPGRIRIVEVDTDAIYKDFQTRQSYRRRAREFKARMYPQAESSLRVIRMLACG